MEGQTSVSLQFFQRESQNGHFLQNFQDFSSFFFGRSLGSLGFAMTELRGNCTHLVHIVHVGQK